MNDYNDDYDDDTTMDCPHCQAEIYDDAVCCPHCGNYVTSDSSTSPSRSTWRRYVAIAIVVLLCLVFLQPVIQVLRQLFGG